MLGDKGTVRKALKKSNFMGSYEDTIKGLLLQGHHSLSDLDYRGLRAIRDPEWLFGLLVECILISYAMWYPAIIVHYFIVSNESCHMASQTYIRIYSITPYMVISASNS